MRLSKIQKLILTAFLLSWTVVAGKVSSQLDLIPLKDREILEAFFKQLISHEPFAYVIFGDKPIAITGYRDIAQKIPLLKRNRPRVEGKIFAPFFKLNFYNLNLFRGFKTWKKYRSLFPMENYLILECENLIPNDYRCILIVNKRAFLDTVACHLDDFQRILGPEITPLLLLEKFQTEKNIFQGVLKRHETLIGILFGFGKHNAELYQERKELLERTCIRLEECPQKLEGFSTLEFPLNRLRLSLPRFAADLDHFETKILKKNYHLQRQKILEHYKSDNFLETTLEQLCSKQSAF